MEQVLQTNPDRYVQPPHTDNWQDGGPQGGANADCEITFAAVQGMRHVVWNVFWSYDDDPTGGYITAYSGPGHRCMGYFPITSGGVGWLRRKIVGKMNQPLTIRLGAGGAGVTGYLDVEQHWIRPA